jgi:hypothetical protein
VRTNQIISHLPLRHWRGATAALAAAGLTSLSILAGSNPAVAAPGPSLQGAQLLQGQLAGAPTLGGMRVAVYAWPRQPAMAGMHNGERFWPKLVGTAMSSSAGAYSVRVAHPTAITASTYYGTVNFVAEVAGHGYFGLFFFPREVFVPRQVMHGGVMLGAVDGKATAGPVRAGIHVHWVGPKSTAASVITPDSSNCWVRTGDLGQVVGRVGGEWQKGATVGTTSVAKEFSYTSGTSTTTGVAINTNISQPNWSASSSNGTEVVHNDSSTQGFPTVNLSRYAETDMEEGLFSTCQISGEEATFPYQVNGGVIQPLSTAPRATHCVVEPHDAYIIKSSTTAFTFSDGVDLSVIGIGVSLSSVTGYSTDATEKYTWNNQGGWGCGAHNAPLGTSPGPGAITAAPTSSGT